ncbi:MAG: ribosomal protein [Deltaproteobacteria bacterium]|jgi:large subunit ribosomal protein L3|nr:ribosomal protein [Deltaproteobacteria bacterium]
MALERSFWRYALCSLRYAQGRVSIMLKGIIGKKLGMTQVFHEEGGVVPVTVIQAGPCKVIQVKTAEKEKYGAVQLGFEERPAQKMKKPLQGHFTKAQVPAFRYLREFRVSDPGAFQVGQEITVESFQVGDRVDVTGVSKGKGFMGVVKRWHFRGGRATHGSMFHRAPGSIGASSYPSRTWPGQKMGGQMGNQKATLQNLEVMDIRPRQNLLLVKGAVPGGSEGLVLVCQAKKKKSKAES